MEDERVPRWCEDASDLPYALRDALDRERQDLPSEAQLERIAASVSIVLTGTPAARSEPTSEPARAAMRGPAVQGGAAGLLKLSCAVAAVAVAAFVAWPTDRDDSESSRRTLAPVRAPASTSPAKTTSVVPSPGPVDGPQPPMPHTATAQVAERSRKPVGTVREAKAGTKELPTAELAAGIDSDELEIVRQARAALTGDPARALALTGEHARRHPNGTFVEEREALAIEALVRLGYFDSARVRSQVFMTRFPRSAYARRIAALLKQH